MQKNANKMTPNLRTKKKSEKNGKQCKKNAKNANKNDKKMTPVLVK